jgi:cellulose synthase/poly-beta-1,6-N-acetylglucosamine synthase-like glycosyltransferase
MEATCFLPSISDLSSGMMHIVFSVLVLYVGILILLLIGLQKIAARGVHQGEKIHFVTVVVAFRNELENLPTLLNCLGRQNYSSFEVILVDDHSSDDGFELASEWCRQHSSFKVIRQEGTGKKAAITEGVLAAKGDIILTTDADCSFSENWISEVNTPFGDPRIKLVFGPVHLRSGGKFFGRIQQMEFASVIGTGMAAYGLGHALYCNGANMAYRKEAFLEVEGFAGSDHIASGDDQFVLKKIRERFPSGVFLLNSDDALVSAAPQPTFRGFVQQRLRWAGKWRAGLSVAGKIAAVSIVVIQCFVLMAWGMILAGSIYPPLVLILGIKMLLEYILISSVPTTSSKRASAGTFFILQFLYPPYVVLIGVLSNFVGFVWKGRRHAPRPAVRH